MDIQSAKAHLGIPEIWQLLGLSGAPASPCRSPFREDSNPSFSVYDDGKRWKDFGTGDGGDAIDFLAKAKGIGLTEARKEFIRIAGGYVHMTPRFFAASQSKKTLELPALSFGTEEELARLSFLRGISLKGLEAAQAGGVLYFANLRGHSAWVLTDAARRNAQARRLDGQPWTHIHGKKAWTLPGSEAQWPVGVATSKSLKLLCLCEGGPDLLAAFDFLAAHGREDIVPIAILGAGMRIHTEALSRLQDTRVRIFPHVDASGVGERAASQWAQQLQKVGAKVDGFSFQGLLRADGTPIKDFNDCLYAADPYALNAFFWENL